jgi:hypothetical protein
VKTCKLFIYGDIQYITNFFSENVLKSVMFNSLDYGLHFVNFSVIIIIIINNLVFTIVQDIYNYVPEANHVFRVFAVLYLQFMLHVMLFRP